MARALPLLFLCLMVHALIESPCAHADAQDARHLALAIVDQRSSGKLAAEELIAALEESLGVDVRLAGADAGAAELGLLSVMIAGQSATLVWALPDGRSSSSRVAVQRSSELLHAQLASEFLWMVTAAASTDTSSYGELLDPYCASDERQSTAPAPWSVMRRQRKRARHMDLLDPYEPLGRRQRLDPTPDPWLN